LDGTSIKLWDGTGGHKDFGGIGTYHNGATGLELNNALAVAADGVPIGVAAQVWWRRPRRRPKERRPCYRRRVEEKETPFLLDCIDQVTETFAKHAPQTKCWFKRAFEIDVEQRNCGGRLKLKAFVIEAHNIEPLEPPTRPRVTHLTSSPRCCGAGPVT
jgi:hypothetical protein